MNFGKNIKRLSDITMLQPFIDQHKCIVIIGLAGAGKTTLTDSLDTSEFNVIHTDKYIELPYKDQLYKLLSDIKMFAKDNAPLIIEGVIGYRLLRKIEQLNISYIRPDLIIICVSDNIPDNPINAGLIKIWNDYLRICKSLPTIIVFER